MGLQRGVSPPMAKCDLNHKWLHPPGHQKDGKTEKERRETGKEGEAKNLKSRKGIKRFKSCGLSKMMLNVASSPPKWILHCYISLT